jgi:excinuclease ABC subunit A
VARGGEIVAEGSPEAVAADKASVTGFYLKPLLARQAPSASGAVVEKAPVRKGRKKVAA